VLGAYLACLDEKQRNKDDMMFENSNLYGSYPQSPRPRFQRSIIVISLVVVGGILGPVVAFEILDHNERVLTDQIRQSEMGLQETGGQIANIKDHEFKTMAEYINAYAQIGPLLNDYDHKLQAYADLCKRAQRNHERRSMINIEPFHNRQNSALWRNTLEIVDLVTHINSVMRKEESVIHDMSSFPEHDQLQFWHEEFVPLLAQEHALRERLLLAGQRISPEPTSQ
jgi:hypothetical protein